jgi:hypothetical protein
MDGHLLLLLRLASTGFSPSKSAWRFQEIEEEEEEEKCSYM